jgi:hypothetical protein
LLNRSITEHEAKKKEFRRHRFSPDGSNDS